MKNIILILLGITTYFFVHLALISYENTKAHTTLNKTFVDYLSKLIEKENPEEIGFSLQLNSDVNKLKGLGVTNPGFFDYTTSETEINLTPGEWISHGGFSADEPEVPAAVRHFYDPLGLKNGKKYLTNRGTYWEGFYPNPGIDAIEWALGDTEKGAANKWSAKQGKEYILQAIQERDENKRRELMAKAWRCFGETLHNLADMACPPHTRNDSHAAPLGLGWGSAFGSPDPYEELFSPAWVSAFSNSEPDPNLKEAIINAKTMREVHELLAKFTNSNFFTGETISGKQDEKEIKPLNGEKAFPSPKLENLEYIPEEFTYYKNFPSGRRVKMCKDAGYFNKIFRNRGYPYIDYDCAKSQASELVPNFLFAALKDFALYMPPLQVWIENVDYEQGLIAGKVASFETEEYKNSVNYNGKIIITVDSKTYSNIECNNGNFEYKIPKTEIEKAKKIQASVDFCGILFISAPFKKSDYSDLKEFYFFACVVPMEASSGRTYNYCTEVPDRNQYNKIVWNNNKFTYTNSSSKRTHTLEVEMDPFNKGNINRIYFYERIIEPQTEGNFDLSDTTEIFFELNQKDDILYYNSLTQMCHIDNNELLKTLKKISFVEYRRYGDYDNNGKIIGVKREVYTYDRIKSSSDNQIMLIMTK